MFLLFVNPAKPGDDFDWKGLLFQTIFVFLTLQKKQKIVCGVCGSFHVRFRFVFTKVYIFVQQKRRLFDFKTP